MKTIFYYLKALVLLLQTVLTFWLIYNKNSNKTLNYIILGLLGLYVFVVLMIVCLGASKKKYSPETLLSFKKSLKTVSRLLNIYLVLLSILTIISAKSDLRALLGAVLLLVFNLLLLSFSLYRFKRKEKRLREKKRKRREKQNSRVGSENTYNYGNHKKEKL